MQTVSSERELCVLGEPVRAEHFITKKTNNASKVEVRNVPFINRNYISASSNNKKTSRYYFVNYIETLLVE